VCIEHVELAWSEFLEVRRNNERIIGCSELPERARERRRVAAVEIPSQHITATDQAISSIDVAARRGTRCHVEKLTDPARGECLNAGSVTKLIAARLILTAPVALLPPAKA